MAGGREGLNWARETADQVPSLVAFVAQEHGTRLLASLIRVCGGDFQLAEDALQEALMAALEVWPREGAPQRADAWIMTTARRKAIDQLRRAQTLTRKREQLEYLVGQEQAAEAAGLQSEDESVFEDDQLRLVFTCCHPALALEARVALTLRTVAGLEVNAIAKAFLVSGETMAKRLTRARLKIREARIPYRIPDEPELPDRLDSVLRVVYLVFNEGYLTSTTEELVRAELCDEAIRLGRLLLALMPDEPEVKGLLALMLLNDSRREARTNAAGELQTLDEQDRSRWRRDEIAEGVRLIEAALRTHRAGVFQLQAAIAAVHAESPSPEQTDWRQIVLLYNELLRLEPSPVIMLNRAAAVGMSEGPERGLALMDEIERSGALGDYYLLPAARADLLRRANRKSEAIAAYERALSLCTNPVERRYLYRRLREVEAR